MVTAGADEARGEYADNKVRAIIGTGAEIAGAAIGSAPGFLAAGPGGAAVGGIGGAAGGPAAAHALRRLGDEAVRLT